MARGKKKEENLTLEERLEQALVPEEEWPYEVPGNWCWTRLKDVASVITGGTPSKNKMEYYGGTFPFFKPADLDYGRNMVEASEFLSEEGKAVSRLIPAKSTAVCCIGSIGKCGYLCVDGTTNQQINSAVPKVNPLFLYYYCNTILFTTQLRLKASATTISIVNKSKMEQCLFPLPPLKEQQRITNHIEELFYKLDEIKGKVQYVLEDSENRKAAILHKAFSGELTEQWRKEQGIEWDSWKTQKMSSLGKLERGKSKHRPRNDPSLFGDKYPFIQTGDISKANVYIKEHKQSLSELGLKQSRLFPAGTLCITIAANIGNIAILSYDCCFPDSVVGFTPYDETDSKFIYYIMCTMQKKLEAEAPATAQKNINLKVLNDITLNTPLLPEQHEIVKILDDLLEKESRIEIICESIFSQINLLKKSILSRAFRGELGTNNPDEESAIELLKTIL